MQNPTIQNSYACSGSVIGYRCGMVILSTGSVSAMQLETCVHDFMSSAAGRVFLIKVCLTITKG
jgi:hypothetical protein